MTPIRVPPGPTIPLVLASVLIVVLLVIAAASRSGPAVSPQPTLSGTPRAPVSDVPYPPEPTTGVGSEGGTLPPTTPIPGVSTWSGSATWYCGHGAACTHGYGPSDMVAAIDRKDSPFRKGDRVVVRYHCGKGCDRHVTVRIVDTCACGGARLIDLTSGAFRRLAPLGQGVIPVTLEAAGASIQLPPTDR